MHIVPSSNLLVGRSPTADPIGCTFSHNRLHSAAHTWHSHRARCTLCALARGTGVCFSALSGSAVRPLSTMNARSSPRHACAHFQRPVYWLEVLPQLTPLAGRLHTTAAQRGARVSVPKTGTRRLCTRSGRRQMLLRGARCGLFSGAPPLVGQSPTTSPTRMRAVASADLLAGRSRTVHPTGWTFSLSLRHGISDALRLVTPRRSACGHASPADHFLCRPFRVSCRPSSRWSLCQVITPTHMLTVAREHLWAGRSPTSEIIGWTFFRPVLRCTMHRRPPVI